jgi:hypothetical protein
MEVHLASEQRVCHRNHERKIGYLHEVEGHTVRQSMTALTTLSGNLSLDLTRGEPRLDVWPRTYNADVPDVMATWEYPSRA